MLIFPNESLRPTIMVVSHERSGAKFLMDGLERAFGYAADANGRLDLDWNHLPINLYDYRSVDLFFRKIRPLRLRSLIGSHHPADFFAPIIRNVTESAIILYVHRHPWDVMQSLWRWLGNRPSFEGPRCESPAMLMRTPPAGNLMRFQMAPLPSMLHRWADHVATWTALSRRNGRIHLVAFDRLRDDYPNLMREIGTRVVGAAPADETPSDGIADPFGLAACARERTAMSEADATLLQLVAGRQLRALGYQRFP